MTGKENLGHKRRLNHRQKRLLATNMIKPDEIVRGVFYSDNWWKRKNATIYRVRRREIRAKYYSEVRTGVR